jgi:PAS domain S-box-containing protein
MERETTRQLGAVCGRGDRHPSGGVPAFLYRCLNDSEWTMLSLGEGCRTVTGYGPEELLDNRSISYSDIIHPADRLGVSLEVQTALAERRPFQLHYRVQRPDGALTWVWEQGQGVYSEQGVVLFIEGLIAGRAE